MRSEISAWSDAGRTCFCGLVLPLLIAVGLFSLSMAAGRFTPLRPPASTGNVSLAEDQRLDVDIPTSVDYPEVESSSELRASSSESVLGGADLVAYRDLEEGGVPAHGVQEHTAVFHDGTLFFPRMKATRPLWF